MKGKFITLEGGEGCGKTTQSKMLKSYIESKGYEVHYTKEPGGNVIGNAIRTILLNPKYEGLLIPKTELFLFEAARAQFVNEIKSFLDKGIIVLSDRYYDSTTAYQGYGRGMDRKVIDYLTNYATGGLNPDLTCVIDISSKFGLKKATKSEFGKADRMEQENLEFHTRVNKGFLEIAKQEPDRVKVINYSAGNPNIMQKVIQQYVNKILEK